MASATTHDFPLASETYTPSDGIGSPDGEGGAVDHGIDSEAGASGGDSGGAGVSEEALIAIIVVVSAVAVLGIAMAVLFYVAKKREWKMREKIRHSARKVVNALTPRRSEFPREVKDSMPKGAKGRKLSDEVPPTPRLRPEDVEKGLALKIQTEERNNKKKWTRK